MKKMTFIFLIVFVSFLSFADLHARSGSSFLGKSAPEIDAGQWINSEPLSLEQLKGKIVIVEFFATWCPPCRASVPHLVELYKKYKDKGVVIISLTREDMKVVQPFAKDLGMVYPVGVASSSGDKYGVTGIPHALIVGKDGVVLWEGHPMSGLDEALEKALNK